MNVQTIGIKVTLTVIMKCLKTAESNFCYTRRQVIWKRTKKNQSWHRDKTENVIVIYHKTAKFSGEGN